LADDKEKNEQREIVKILNVLYKEVVSSCKERRDEEEKEFQMYLGKQEIVRKGKQRANTKTNFLYAQIETEKPILTANTPTAELTPVIETDNWKKVAQEMENVVNRILRRNDPRSRYMDIVNNGLFSGVGWFKVIFNPESFAGYGDLEIRVPRSQCVYLEPGIDDYRDVNYVFEVTKVNELTMLRRYPDRKADTKALFAEESQVVETPVKDGKEVGHGYVATAPGVSASTVSTRFFDIGLPDQKRKKTIDLVEAWFHDGEMVEQEIEIIDEQGQKVYDDKTGKFKTEKKLGQKYQFGRVILFSGNMVFDDRPNKFPGLPYFPWYNVRVPGDQYGMNALRQIVPPQKQYNSRKNQITDSMAFSINPRIYVDKRAGLDIDRMTNSPGEIHEVNDVNLIKHEYGPGVPGSAFDSLNIEQSNIEAISGVREITQGTIPGDIRSGAAIEALQEAADVRLRGKSGELESTTFWMVRFIINMVVAFYKHKIHFRVDSEIEKMPEFKMWLDKELSADFFDIDIRAGVNLPRSRIAAQQFMQWMYDRDLADPIYIIDQSKIEGKEQLIKRMQPLWDAVLEAKIKQAQAGSQEQPQPEQGG